MITISTSQKKELSNLAKIYTNNSKYNGRNNSFIFKLALFVNICSQANILPKANIKNFFTMLKNLALDFYYLNISTNTVIIKFN